MHPDLSWLGVLEHHARRTPDKPLAVFGDDVVTYQGMVDRAAALAGGLHARGVGAGDVVGLLSYNNTRVPRRRSSPPTTSARSRCRSTGGSRRRSCGSSSTTPKRARSSATTRSSTSRTRRPTTWTRDLVRVCISTERVARVGAVRRSAADVARPARVPRPGRRPPPADVHVGHDRAPEGRHDHPRQPGVEELRARHRVRLHQRRRRARLRAAVPRRRARPRHDHDDRGRARRPSSTACSTPSASSTRSSGRG